MSNNAPLPTTDETNLDNPVRDGYNTATATDASSGDDQALFDHQMQLQDDYISALNSGNEEEIVKTKRKIDIFLGDAKPDEDEAAEGTTENGGDKAPEVKPPAPSPSPDNEVSKEGETSAKDGATPPNAEEAWLNSLEPSVRQIVEQRLDTERKAREYHQKKYESDIGRVNAYQRKYEDERKAREQLEQKLREGATNPQPSNSTATPQVGTQTANADKIRALSDRITKLKGPDPELAELLELTRDALIESQQAVLASVPKMDMAPLEELKAKIAQQEYDLVVQNERQRLEQLSPGSLAIIDYQDPKTGWSPWHQFVKELPPKMAELANDSNADTYAYLMTLYSQWAERYNAAHGYTSRPTQQTTATQPVVVDPRAEQVQQARQAKLTTSAAAPAKSSPPPTYKPSLEERLKNPPEYGSDAYFKLMDDAIEAERKKAGG